MQDPHISHIYNTEKNALMTLYPAIMTIISKDSFYTKPTDDDIKSVTTFIKRVQSALRTRGDKNKYQVPASTLDMTNMLIDGIKEQDYDGFLIQSFRSSWCEASNDKQFLAQHPKEFCKFYITGQLLMIPSILEKGKPEANRRTAEINTQRGAIFNDMPDPIAFIETAFSEPYNKHVIWRTTLDTVVTNKAFSKQDDAAKCVKNLERIGIEGCLIKPQEKGYRVEIPCWRVLQAMDKSQQQTSEQDKQNDQNRLRSPGRP
jgi:hypothetical protein